MNRELDVALRLRLENQLSGPARAATRDIEALRSAATRLNGTTGRSRVAQDLQKTGSAARTAGRDVVDLTRVADRLGTTSGPAKLQRDVLHLGSAGIRTARDITSLGRAAERLGSSNGAAKLERDLERVGRRADETRRKLSVVGGVHAGAGASTRGTLGEFGNEAMAAAGLASGARFGMTTIGAAGMAAGSTVAAAGAALYGATRQAITFETAMAEVKKAVNDVSPEALQDLERHILRISRSPGGPGKEEVAKLVAQAGFAGRPNEDLPRFAKFGAMAAGAFQMTPEEAGDKLAKLGTAYKLPQAGIEDLANAVNLLGDNSAAKERGIIDFLTRVGSGAEVFGLASHQAAAFGASIQSLGVEPEIAATGFNALLMKLGAANKQGKDFQKGLRELGTNSRQVMANIKVDPVQALLTIFERINKVPKEKRLGVLTDLMGLEYGDDVIRMAGALDQIQKNLGLVADQSKRAGSVEKTFEIFSATTQAKINNTGTAIAAFASKVGQRFTPVIGVAAEALTRFFNKLTDNIELAERLNRIVPKIAAGTPLSPGDAEFLKTNPSANRAAQEQARRAERERIREAPDGEEEARARQHRQGIIDDMRKRIDRQGAAGLDTSEARRKLEETERRFKELHPDLPGADKRSEIPLAARATFAAYHGEIERAEDRTLRMTREFARDMRDELGLGGAGRFGEARIFNASLPGGSARFGDRGGLTARGSGAGPGRFGGGISAPSGGGGGNLPSVEAAPGAYKGILDHIARSEGTSGRGDYNASLGYGRFLPGGKEQNLTGKSLNEILALGKHMRGRPGNPNSSALGRYQIVGQTLRGLMAKLGLSGNELFDEKMQDRLGAELVRQRGASAVGLSQEWASLRGQKLGEAVRLVDQIGRTGASTAAVGENGQVDPLGGAARRLTSRFGMRAHPIHGGQRFHAGVDLAAPAGSPVNAMQAGRISSINAHGDVTVTHPDGSTKTYRHIAPRGIVQGQDIAAGQAIGALRARDPRSTGPHLHLEATDAQGRRIDPEEELQAAGRRLNGTVAGRPQLREKFQFDDTNTLSPRYAEPPPKVVDAGSEGRDVTRRRLGRGSGGPVQLTQNFHGGFDAETTARRAQLEQNRAVRRAQAGALHDVGRLS